MFLHFISALLIETINTPVLPKIIMVSAEKIKNLFSRRFPRSDRQLIEDYYLGSWVNFFGFIRNFTMMSSICHTAIFFLDIIYEKFIDSALSVQISGQGSTDLNFLDRLLVPYEPNGPMIPHSDIIESQKSFRMLDQYAHR